MRPPTPPLSLSDGQRETLQALAGSSTATHCEVLRARALLAAGEGLTNTASETQRVWWADGERRVLPLHRRAVVDIVSGFQDS